MASEAPQWKLWLRTFFFPPDDREFDSGLIDNTAVVVAVSVDSDASADPLLKFFRMKFWSRIQYESHEVKGDVA